MSRSRADDRDPISYCGNPVVRFVEREEFGRIVEVNRYLRTITTSTSNSHSGIQSQYYPLGALDDHA